MNVKSAERTMQILQAVAERPRTHVELAQILGIPKSSLTALLHTLESGKFLSLGSDGRHYRIGSVMVLIAQKYLAGMDLAGLSQDAIHAVTSETAEATAMVISAGEDILVIGKAMGDHPIRRSMQVGERAPMTLTAAGRVFLAFMAPSARDEIVSRQLAETGKAPDNGRLATMLRSVADGGIAYSYEELLPGIIAMAVPVWGRDGKLVGSLSVSAPASRFDPVLEQRIADSLRRNAGALGEVLGHRPEPKFVQSREET